MTKRLFVTLALVILAAPAASVVAQESSYLVGPKDILAISVYDDSDLSGQYNVEQDGTLMFPLINGRAHLGFRRFRTLDEAVPDFTGVVANLDVRYALRATQVALRLQRDVAYSFEINEPYYLSTAWNVSLTQAVSPAWDIVTRVGRQYLDYRVALLTGERRDIGSSFGGGVGYRLGRSARFGVNVDYVQRRSEARPRPFLTSTSGAL